MNFALNLRFLLYQPACLLRVSGLDAPEFLQGQFSNDLRRLGDGESVYGLWLDRRGRVQADSFVQKRADGFWLASTNSAGPALRKWLEEHIVADEVSVEDCAGAWRGAAILGEGSGSWLASESRQGLCFKGRRVAGESWEWLFPADSAGSVRSLLGAHAELSAEEADRMRIAAGVPLVPVDIGPGDLPNEGGLETVAVSFAKGCYLGQEVMARLKTKGTLRRRLHRVEGSGAAPALPAPLWQAGRQVGELRSAANAGEGFIGLAMLSLMHLRSGDPMSFSADGPPTLRLEQEHGRPARA